VVDLSGSMRLDSLLAYGVSGSRTQSMNGEADFPKFAQYSLSTAQTQMQYSADWQAPSGELAGTSNIVTATGDGNPVVGDFYGAWGSTGTPFDTTTQAFVNNGHTGTTAPSSYDTTPGGDAPLSKKNGATTYATNLNQIIGRSTSDKSSADPTGTWPTGVISGGSSSGKDHRDTTWEPTGLGNSTTAGYDSAWNANARGKPSARATGARPSSFRRRTRGRPRSPAT
jgi:hypothetical protein